jgi:NDP-sugar pyrophosphorylase family protein
LKTYSSFSSSEFVICCCCKGYVLKEYFANYFLHMSDVTFHVRTNSMEVHQKMPSPVRSTWWIPGKPPLREAEPLQRLAAEGQLQAYRHHGYWQPMDTLRDRVHLEELWVSGKAPWKRSKP